MFLDGYAPTNLVMEVTIVIDYVSYYWYHDKFNLYVVGWGPE